MQAALPVLATHRGSTILDYGCGIGEDVLALHRAGFHVVACDLASPPTDFLSWRAPRHDYPHPVYQPNNLPNAPQPDILWIMDTLDHLPDLHGSLAHTLQYAELVISENLLVDRAHGHQRFHYRRPLAALDAMFNSYGLRREPAIVTPPALTVWRP